MTFILNLFSREIRSSWRRLIFFFLCIAIGVGSVVALRSLIQNLGKAVTGDARALMTADVEVSTTNPFAPAEIAKIEEVIAKYPIVEARNEAITTATMARPADLTREGLLFTELKGIERPFPLVGNFTLSDGTPFDFTHLENNGAVVAPLFLEQLNLKVGDKFRVGETDFTVRGVFDEEPGGASGFRLGPRVFVEKKAFDQSGLTRTGSRIRRRILYRTSENPTQMVKDLREALKGTILSVQSYRETEENLGAQFERTENYLSLTGLLILALGGIGVWNVARVFVEQKRKAIAVLKCLGANNKHVILVYIFQVLTLGFLGSFFGVFLAQAALWFVRYRFGPELPENMSYGLQTASVWQGVVLGVLVSFLFSVLPLLHIRNIKPNLLLRDENNEAIRRLDPTKWFFAFLILSVLLGLASWQAGSLVVGAAFMVGLAVTSVFLYITAVALTSILRKTKNLGSFPVSQAINSLYRPGNQTRVLLLAIGLGTFIVLAVQSLQANLIREFDFSRNQNIPSVFLADIQRKQVDGLKEFVRAETGEVVKPIPTVRARLALVNGEPFDFAQREMRQRQGQIGREFAITYRPSLDDNEKVVNGTFWDAAPSPDAEVSVEEGMADNLKVKPGDSITFDVLGRRMTAKVTSLRKLDLRSTRSAFVFVFRPGVLEAAPQTFAVPLTKRLPGPERERLKRKIVDKFPNTQVFDVADILKAVEKLLANFVLAISFVGSFVILTGILILIGSVALTKSQRIYENAVLKTLGAGRGVLVGILLAEYSILGILAGIIGALFAVLLSWTVSKFIFDIGWQFDPGLMLAGILATALLVVVIGLVSSFEVVFRKPLSILRSE